MAGLGTGAAPFRAFLQHRAMLAEKNVPVGPMYYYFGSRHRSQEYLYGEEVSCPSLMPFIFHDVKQPIPFEFSMRRSIHKTKNSQLILLCIFSVFLLLVFEQRN